MHSLNEFNDRSISAGKQKAVNKLNKSSLPGIGAVEKGKVVLKLDKDMAEFTGVDTMRVHGNNRDISKGNSRVGTKQGRTGLATKSQQKRVIKKLEKLVRKEES